MTQTDDVQARNARVVPVIALGPASRHDEAGSTQEDTR
jgi:hypothetical protein